MSPATIQRARASVPNIKFRGNPSSGSRAVCFVCLLVHFKHNIQVTGQGPIWIIKQ